MGVQAPPSAPLKPVIGYRLSVKSEEKEKTPIDFPAGNDLPTQPLNLLLC
jgi:hypothetical protein